MLAQKNFLMIYIKKKCTHIKINISKKEFLNELNEEIKKNRMSKLYLKNHRIMSEYTL